MSDLWHALGMAANQPLTSTYGDPVAAEEEGGRRFAALLREYRKRLDLRQEDVADRSGVSLSTINRWERGMVRNPKPDEVRAVCEAIGLPTVAAGIALGYIAPAEAEHLPEPPRRLDPTVAEAVAILEDEGMSREKKFAVLEYLRWLHATPETRQPGTDEDRSRAAS